MKTDVHTKTVYGCSFIHDLLKQETTQMSIHILENYSALIRREWISDRCNDGNESQKYLTERKRPDPKGYMLVFPGGSDDKEKATCCRIPHLWHSRNENHRCREQMSGCLEDRTEAWLQQRTKEVCTVIELLPISTEVRDTWLHTFCFGHAMWHVGCSLTRDWMSPAFGAWTPGKSQSCIHCKKAWNYTATKANFICKLETWTIKKAECRRIDAFKLWCERRLLRVPWTARRSNESILKEINPGNSLEGLMLKLKLQHFRHLMRRTTGKDLDAGKDWRQEEKGATRGWDGWMASLTQWTKVWANSRRQ